MTTRIADSSTPNVNTGATAARVTPPPSRPFQSVVRAGGHAVMSTAEGAVRRLPGGPVLAAAFRSGSGGPVPPQLSAPGPAGTAEPEAFVASTAAGADGDLENVMAQHAEQNLYYLALQQRISAESQQYTTMSNVLKARHDTVKNAIGNIR